MLPDLRPTVAFACSILIGASAWAVTDAGLDGGDAGPADGGPPDVAADRGPIDGGLPDADGPLPDARPPLPEDGCRVPDRPPCEGAGCPSAACTPEQAGVQTCVFAQCDNDFFDPGCTYYCCDGADWRYSHADPDPCGVPPPEPEPEPEPDAACPGASPQTCVGDCPGPCGPGNAGHYESVLADCGDAAVDRGAVQYCCDGQAWRFVSADPDPCGVPDAAVEPDAGDADAGDADADDADVPAGCAARPGALPASWGLPAVLPLSGLLLSGLMLLGVRRR